MPLLSDANLLDWEDPDLVPRPVVTIGAADFVMGNLGPKEIESLGREETDFHRHRKGQFLLWLRGVLTCEVEGGFWIVPPQGGIWVPGGVVHRMEAAGTIECYVSYVDPGAAANLPATCCTLATTALLRELVIRSASLPTHYEEGGMASHLVTLLLDEMAVAPAGDLHLPMPSDGRLRKIVEAILADPADRGTIQTWARRAGLSARTLSRLITEQTGMSFGRWRQQLHLMLSLQWLAKGLSIKQVADDLGYENASSFVLMFRKALGAPPGRYMAERHSGTSG